MKEYEELVEALVGMATITRPRLDVNDSPATLRQKNIQHGICDLLEDAAVAIDDLMSKAKVQHVEERSHSQAA